MEIRDYLKTMGRRFWILLLVPLLAGGVAITMLSSEPQQFRTTATVGSADLVSGRNETEQYVADFTAAMTTPAIIDRVAEKTGVSARTIRRGLRAQRLGASSFIQVAFQTSDPVAGKPVAVVGEVAREALAFIFQSPEEFAQKRRDIAAEAVEKANAAVDAFSAEIGIALPDEEFRIKQSVISQLRVRFEEAAAGGDAATSERLKSAIAAREAELVALGPKVVQFNRLTEAREPVIATLREAEEILQRARARADVSRASSMVTVSTPVPIPKTSGIIRRTGAVVAASLLLAIGLVGLLEMGAARRGRTVVASARPRPETA